MKHPQRVEDYLEQLAMNVGDYFTQGRRADRVKNISENTP
jgi:hypothetical protein